MLEILLLVTLTVSCSTALSLVGPRRSVADLLAQPPARGESVYVDAYVSLVDGASIIGQGPAGGLASDSAGRYAILADQPFLSELSLLGDTLPNVLPAGAAWMVIAAPDADTPGAPDPFDLPYYARLRGRLSALADTSQSPVAARVFVVDEVVRTHARRPPEAVQNPDLWQRYRDEEAGFSIPLPPGWQTEKEGDTLKLESPLNPGIPITVRIHPGETHDDPYDPEAAPALLRGQDWKPYAQSAAAGRMSLNGYRIDNAKEDERSTSILWSAHGRTYELGVRYPLGFAAPQAVLNAYSAIVTGFRLDTPPEPSPTPPVRQALGAGPFISEEAALAEACKLLEGELEAVTAQLVSEADARKLAPGPAAFRGHFDGIWAVSARTPRAAGGGLRILLDAVTGRELCRQEVSADDLPAFDGSSYRLDELVNGRPQRAISRGERWIEVDIGRQVATAWEGDTPVRRMMISSGTVQNPTVIGQFRIYYKVSSMTMSGPGYSIPGVPNVMFFHLGYGLHGAYWHWSFGTRISHGCVNMTLGDAAWLFNWTSPQLPAGAYSVFATPCNLGTLVVVHY